MRGLGLLLACLLTLVCTAAAATPAGQIDGDSVHIPTGRFITLTFHDVRDDVEPEIDQDPYAISTERLAQLFDWFHSHGWHPVSLDQIEAARYGRAELPANAVLLSFDDGLESIYTKVFPLLKAFDYPALFALETGWLQRVGSGERVTYTGDQVQPVQNADEVAAAKSPNLQTSGEVLYNGSERGSEGFVNWAQVREMQASGLASFASHSHNLHHGILANPQGNLEPAALTRRYDADTGRYETDDQFSRRIRDDLQRSIDEIERHTGVRPHAMVWPYGAMSDEVVEIAESLGFSLSFGLGDSQASSTDDISRLGRLLVMNNPEPADVESQIEQTLRTRPQVKRAVQVDLDYVYDTDPDQVNANLGRLLDRIKAMNVRTVYLQAYADPDGDGTASALYFPNDYLPMRADLFNRVAWQLRTRANVNVYAWLPLLAFDLPDTARADQLRVRTRDDNGQPQISPHDYRRLSPFLPDSQEIVSGIYSDLAKSTSAIEGVLIHDDAYLAADEDATACLTAARWPGTGAPIENCDLGPRDKTLALINFGKTAIATMRRHINLSNDFHAARNLYARVVLDPSAEARFAQALGPFVANYDDVALMAMPYLDGTEMAPMPWLTQLADRVKATPGALDKTVFELQARDWRDDRWIDGDTLRGWMQGLVRQGVLNLAYYPDDFINNQPEFKPTYIGISLNEFPHREGAP